MILDNISRALKEQNWLAAAIEFVIVIFGVVIGFQVNAWNESRIELEQERKLIERLAVEVDGALSGKRDELAIESANVEALAAIRLLADSAEHVAFDDELCGSIDASHAVLWAPAQIPMLDEIGQTGALEKISEDGLRALIVGAISARDRARELVAFSRLTVNPLRETHPELLQARITEFDGRWPQTKHFCDWAGMHRNPLFQNLALENFFVRATLRILIQSEVETLEQLNEALKNARL